MSIFVGTELQQILDALESGNMIKSDENKEFVIGVEALPNFPKDTTDRNRTSPFAFTGNKFEFRSLGSSETIACTNCILNTIVANSLKEFADALEGSNNFTVDLNNLLVDTIKKHKRIIFNGNGYDESWVVEAEKRGLPNYVSTVDAVPHYTDEKNIKMFEMFKVYTRTELESRTEIILENYSKVLNIEALTMIDMSRKNILPAGMKFAKTLVDSIVAKNAAGVDSSVEKKLADKVSGLVASIDSATSVLEAKVVGSKDVEGAEANAKYFRNEVFSSMQSLRAVADELETITPEEVWPFPTYGDLLFRV